jgi:tetratricopeptide (TPR) repeat protein
VCLLLQATAWGDGSTRAAREHYRRATKAYDIGQYDEAIREFGEAYKIKDDPTILYNLAQAHRLAGHREEALRTFRMFLLKVPDTPYRADAEARIAELQKAAPAPQIEPRQEPDDEVAQRYFEEGARRYDAGNYNGAIESFEKARRVKSLPALDYNIGRTYDRLDRPRDALVAYKRYVVVTPAPPDLEKVRARIEVLEKRVAAETPPPASPQAAAPKPSGKTFLAAGAAVGAVGVGALAAGIACGVLAKQTADSFTNGSTYDASKDRRGRDYQTAEGVLLGVGGAAVITGAVLLAIGAKQHHAAMALLPTLAPGRAALTLSVPLQ